jgi:hypothetical protein
MGFGDKLKGLRDQAQQAVADNKDKIQGAVQNVGEAANTRTHGKYAEKIAKVGDKVSGGVEKFAAQDEGGAPEGGAGQADTFAAPTVDQPDDLDTPPAAADDAAATSPPEFE